MEDALRVLRGMADIPSGFGQAVALIPIDDLAWGGWLADDLLRVLPSGLIGHLATFIAIAAAFVIVCQRNSLELAGESLRGRMPVYGVVLFSVALYFTLAATSSVFLYFNF
jgi:alginate O-acetyltransferase complex protein AlgI